MHAGESLPLSNTAIQIAIWEAWLDSNPGIIGGHEEGGFIVRDSFGVLSVLRWPRGELNQIDVPPHRNCRIDDCDVIATFHTHPNIGPDFLQEPSTIDIWAVRDDPDLKGPAYRGEFVVSNEWVYLIAPDGEVTEFGKTERVFSE